MTTEHPITPCGELHAGTAGDEKHVEPLFDVVAVDLTTYAERVLATGLTERNADAFVTMAVIRRGVESEFFKAVAQAHSGQQGRMQVAGASGSDDPNGTQGDAS